MKLVLVFAAIILVPIVLLYLRGRGRSNEGAHADPQGNRDIGVAGPSRHSQQGDGMGSAGNL